MTSIQFLGAAGTVTGSSYLVDTGTVKFLVDCGLFQGDSDSRVRNFSKFPYDPSQIDFLILTHAHLDHCGLIPKLFRDGFRGTIHATPATFDLTRSILSDAAHIQEHGATDRQVETLFDVGDAEASFELFQTHPYDRVFKPQEGISVTFRDAGHILGSAMCEIQLAGKKIVFSGDIGNSPIPIMKNPTPIPEADIVICESTYGDRNHEPSSQRAKQLLSIIKTAYKTQGKVIIPSFALDRTQDLLYTLNLFKNQGQMPDMPVILDSPLAIKITDIYRKYTKLFDEEFQTTLKSDPTPFSFPDFIQTTSREESKELNTLEGPAVIIAGSGMADAGRVQYHLLHHIRRPETQVVFVGFQTPGTLGRKLVEGMKRVRIVDSMVAVRAQILRIESFSSHADQKGILKWLAYFKTKPTVFLTHGEDGPRQVLSSLITQKLKLSVHMPHKGEKFEI